MNPEKLLLEVPKARERSARYKALRHLLLQKYPELGEIPKEILTNALRDAVSLDRAIRKLQADNPHLRGHDYDQKTKLAYQKMQELGYDVPPDYTQLAIK